MKLVQAIKGYINNYGKKLETARRERGGERKVRAREKKVTREDLTSDEQQQ